METLRTTCCVVGGGPAGVMLGYLLARAGVDVVVLEKHADFFRDFRGDTVHPSTLEVLYELGLLEDFLKLPHQKLTSAEVRVGDSAFRVADFSHLPTRSKFIALMPQWDFLNFLSDRAKRFRNFQLRMQCEGVNLIHRAARIAGVEAKSQDGPIQIEADLVVACDGRQSSMRPAAGLEVQEFGVPIDVLWFQIPRKTAEPEYLLGTVSYGKGFILIPRGDYFQAGLIIRKGSFDEIKRVGIQAFQRSIAQLAPFLDQRVQELRNWDQIKLLTVQINRLRKWYLRGLLCIGDAAHAMSPAWGVGINLAIQDAVAAANILAEPLRQGRATETVLARVQERREFPTRVTQILQVNAHKMFEKVFQTSGPMQAPWQLKVVTQIPGVPRLMGYAIGMGVRPEHLAGHEPPREYSFKKAAVAAGAFLGAVVTTLRALRGSYSSAA